MHAGKVSIAIVFALLVGGLSVPSQAQTLAAGTSWQNGLGSTLTITNVQATGQFSGYYVTAVASPGCQAVGIQQPLIGWISQSNAITFAVNWTAAGCNSVTAWSGNYNPNNGNISTIWILSSSPGWSNMNIGSDTFVPRP
ncbi:MAG TPA: avidin/streptavidin family protein [Rhizomicrobium sp.]